MKRRVWGRNAVTEILRGNSRAVAVLLFDPNDRRTETRQVLDLAAKAKIETLPRTSDELDAIAGESRHQSLIAISAEEYPYLDLEALIAEAPDDALLVGMEEVTDMGNVGAIIRSCVAFGAYGLFLGRHRTAPVQGAVVRASAGATEHARIARVTNIVRTMEVLREHGWRSIGLVAENATPVQDVDLTGRVALLLGAEGDGLRRLVKERCDLLVQIPMSQSIGSLNVSVAGGIALYESSRQRRLQREG